MSKLIQVRDVPNRIHEALTAKARGQGLSLAAYLRRVLEVEAQRPAMGEVLARAGGRTRSVSMDDVVTIIRQDRAQPS